MPRRRKITKILVAAELRIEDNMIYDRETLKDDLVGEAIKIKSGLYENLVMGNVSEVIIL